MAKVDLLSIANKTSGISLWFPFEIAGFTP